MSGLMLSNQSVTLYSHFLSENLPITIIPTSDPNDPLNRIGTLLQEANRQQNAGQFKGAGLSIAEARRLAQGHTEALAEIDFFCGLLADVGGRAWHVRFGSKPEKLLMSVARL